MTRRDAIVFSLLAALCSAGYVIWIFFPAPIKLAAPSPAGLYPLVPTPDRAAQHERDTKRWGGAVAESIQGLDACAESPAWGPCESSYVAVLLARLHPTALPDDAIHPDLVLLDYACATIADALAAGADPSPNDRTMLAGALMLHLRESPEAVARAMRALEAGR